MSGAIVRALVRAWWWPWRGERPYRMNFDSITWKVRLVWGRTGAELRDEAMVEAFAARHPIVWALAGPWPSGWWSR